MIDIRNGDLLVVNGLEYPVKAAAWWDGSRASVSSFLRMATVTASTKRNPPPISGVRGAPITNLTGLKCTPLDPVDAETRKRLVIETPHNILQTYVYSTTGFTHLVVEDLKR